MTRKYPCHERPENDCKSDYFFWDVEDCATSNKGHSFICERPYENIGTNNFFFSSKFCTKLCFLRQVVCTVTVTNITATRALPHLEELACLGQIPKWLGL